MIEQATELNLMKQGKNYLQRSPELLTTSHLRKKRCSNIRSVQSSKEVLYGDSVAQNRSIFLALRIGDGSVMGLHGHPCRQLFHKLKMLVTNSSIVDVKQLVLVAVNV